MKTIALQMWSSGSHRGQSEAVKLGSSARKQILKVTTAFINLGSQWQIIITVQYVVFIQNSSTSKTHW